MASYTVLAPYVTLPVRDANGAEVVQGFYKGGVATDPIKGDVLDKHVRNNWVEKVSAAKATSEPEPDAVPDAVPAKSASKAVWVAYVTSEDRGELRLSDEDAEAQTRDDLAALYTES